MMTETLHHRRPRSRWKASVRLGQSSMTASVGLALLGFGCAQYGLVEPVVELSALSPELETLTDAKIEIYLKANAKPAFPCPLAVVKLASEWQYYYGNHGDLAVQALHGAEADGWRQLASPVRPSGREVVTQVQLVSPLLAGVGVNPSLKRLRDAAALLHAPVLLVYVQVDSADDGVNDAAIAYWSIVGLFLVPGHTVGHATVCQALLVDTQSGFILATAQGEARREENVLPGAVDIARRRTASQAQAEAIADLHAAIESALVDLAAKPPP